MAMKSLRDPRCKRELLERLSRLRPDSPRRWGKMTAPQMVCHLSDSSRGVTGERPLSRAPGWIARGFLKWFALYVPVKWPRNYPTRPEMDLRLGGSPPTDFLNDVRHLQAVLDCFTRNPRTFQRQRHPIFPDMSERDWMRRGYLHIDHHLRQFAI
jgi:hypothetical protein